GGLHPFPTRRSSDLETRELISQRVKEALSRPETRDLLLACAQARASDKTTKEKIAKTVKELWATEEGRAKFMSANSTKWTPEKRSEEHTSELQSREN